MTDYLQAHRRIKTEIDKQMMDGARVCVSVNSIADRLGMDARTVKTHMDIMKIDDCGTYLDDSKQQFCPVEGVERLRNQFKKRLEKE